MKTRITPYFISLVYEAILKSFWRKKSLRIFLRECKISDNYLSTWSEDESKRDFLARLFDVLPKTDSGRKALANMSEFLIEQNTFPDLSNWEDSEEKIRQAHLAVDRLKLHMQKTNEEVSNTDQQEASKLKFKEKQQQVKTSHINLQKLNNELTELAKRIGSQKAGYEFQEWFYNLMDFYEIQCRRPYTHTGRQIDGSITISETTYLVELKYTVKQSDAPDVDTFYKKVTTKADNTMGIMLSISGYSSIAIQEASSSRTPLLLLDYSHLYLALSGMMSFSEIVNRVRRHASQTGEAYLNASEFNQ